MSYLWLAVLGLLVTGWFVLDGFVLGVGMTSRWLTPDTRQRRWARTAVGPFLLGSEMWLVASAGVLAMTFPRLETALSGGYPIVVTLLAGWMLRDASLWLGRRGTRPRSWRRWDAVWTISSAVVAYCAGALVGLYAHGVPAHGSASIGALFAPVTVVSGLAMVALLALHGTVVIRLRLPGVAGERASALLRRLAPVAAGLAALAVVLGAADAGVHGALAPVALVALAGPVAALLVPRRNAAGHPGQAFCLSGVAAAMPAIATGAGIAGPVATAFGAVALGPVALGVVPVILAYQAWSWWVFRRPVTERATVFF